MERLKSFEGDRLNTWIVSVAIIVAISLVLTVSGCSWQMARVRQSQLQMQNTLQSNTQQLVSNTARIEAITQAVNTLNQNQNKLQAQVTNLQNDNDFLREKLIAVLTQLRDEITKLGAQVKTAGLSRR